MIFYITDRAGETDRETNLPYGEKRERYLA